MPYTDETPEMLVQLMGIRGDVLEQISSHSNKALEFNLTEKQPGIYLVRVMTGNTLEVIKIIKH